VRAGRGSTAPASHSYASTLLPTLDSPLGGRSAQRACQTRPAGYVGARLKRHALVTNSCFTHSHSTAEHPLRYDFSAATTAIYAFWQYDLCDVFIELMKPLVQSSDAAVVRGVSDALWWCLDTGLRLLHPLMPFVTEELWQRLPRRVADLELVPSIMLAAYPVAGVEWADAPLEEQMALIMELVKCLRSERAKCVPAF
jgi:valyl-tRNA synthetase